MDLEWIGMDWNELESDSLSNSFRLIPATARGIFYLFIWFTYDLTYITISREALYVNPHGYDAMPTSDLPLLGPHGPNPPLRGCGED